MEQRNFKFNNNERTKWSKCILFLLFTSTFFFTGCVSNKYFRPYLFEKAKADDMGSNCDTNSESCYLMLSPPSIEVPQKAKVKIYLNDIRVGFSHRNTNDVYLESNGLRVAETSAKNSLGGREFWLVTDIVPLKANSPLDPPGSRFSFATSVKENLESFSFFPMDFEEKQIFNQNIDSSYRVKIRLYQVNGVELKKYLLRVSETSIAKAAYDSVKTFLSSIGKGIFTAGFTALEKEVEEDGLLIEKLLLKSSADLEFAGSFDILIENKEDFPDQTRNYALYDIVKSELDANYDGEVDERAKSRIIKNFKDLTNTDDPEQSARFIINIKEPNKPKNNSNYASDSERIDPSWSDKELFQNYLNSHENIHVYGAQGIELPSKSEEEQFYKNNNRKKIRDNLTKSYVKFTVQILNNNIDLKFKEKKGNSYMYKIEGGEFPFTIDLDGLTNGYAAVTGQALNNGLVKIAIHKTPSIVQNLNITITDKHKRKTSALLTIPANE